jgi:hypothetical protein
MFIHVWPDYVWCEDDELEEMLVGRSDDVMTLEVPEDVDIDGIDDWLLETKPQG